MTKHVWIDGARFALDPAALIGQGGEAEVYDLADGRVLKWWKPADHPDFDGLPDQQAAAKRRLAEAAAKLRALPGNLPACVVAPAGFALSKKNGGDVVGYVMPRVTGVPLHAYGEPRWRRENPVDGAEVIAMLLALHDGIAGLHRAGVVVGDCNDLNVLVDGRRVHLIDVDSYQFGGFACSMFSERFVDPRLCDAQQLVPVRPHDVDSDWFAFAVMAFRTLLGVGPWGGVAKQCPASQRALRRISVLGMASGAGHSTAAVANAIMNATGDVVYPRAARPLATLPDDLLATFREIFERDCRGAFPREQLEHVRLRRCVACGEEHARVRCPTCQALAHVPPAVVHGRLRYHVIAMPSAATDGRVWIDGSALMRRAAFGPERIGSVLAGQTRIWVGDALGIGFYRAGGYAAAFVFNPDRGPLDDRVVLPRIRGRLLASHAVVGSDRAWLFLTTDTSVICVVVDAHAHVVASDTLTDATWLAGIGGAVATGEQLFVPTDDGVTRIEVVQRSITATRVFAETAPLVSAADRLVISSGGLDVIRRRDAIRMHLS